MTCTIASSSACPCGTPQFPQIVCNLPNLPSITYRVGDYPAFRHQLLRPLADEGALVQWRPGAAGDLAVQMLEWWAYLADILTFYNERIANEDYLLTAVLPESVNHLVQLLGYRPRPALGARTVLAGLLTPGARPPVSLTPGLQVQSKPSPGHEPQTFELDSAATLNLPDVITTSVVPQAQSSTLSTHAGASGSSGTGAGTGTGPTSPLWLAGKVTGIKTGDRVLLINATALTSAVSGSTANPADYAWLLVSSTAPKADPLGKPVTEVDFSSLAGSTIFDSRKSAPGSYVLMKSAQSMPLWTYPNSLQSTTTTTVQLAGIARSLTPGSLLMLDATGRASTSPTPSALVYVTGYTELVWYVNCGAGNPPNAWPPMTTTSPSEPVSPQEPAVAMPTATISFPPLDDAPPLSVIARWGFTQIGQVVPVLESADLAISASAAQLAAPTGPGGSSGGPGAPQYPQTPSSVLLEGANGNATAATTTRPLEDGNIAISISPGQPVATLSSPIEVFFNLLPFSRGRTVAAEVLGSGNPGVAGQDFTLQNSPVTYFADTASVSGDGFTSTVEVRVNGVLWQEARSFYGQPANAQIFVLREDDAGETHVMFGDGIHGALPPTGTSNISASYRYGAGADSPLPETLTVIRTPQPGLKGLRNPLAPTGGSDADSADRLRKLAPRSVLTFNRAVSLDDYAAIALTASGVIQALAEFAYDPLAQRPVVQLWIAGDAGAVAAAQAALGGITVPTQELKISPASERKVVLRLTYLRDPRYEDTVVAAGITTALTDPDTGLLASGRTAIGAAVYDSQIEAACLAVAGVLAVHDMEFLVHGLRHYVLSRFRAPGVSPLAGDCGGRRHDPGAGHYFTLAAADLKLAGVAAS
jgi:hypothetical protein